MEIKGCIFDLDGVIVNTAKYHYLSWKKLAKKLDLEFSQELNEQLKGINRMDSLNIILKANNIDFSEEKKEELCAQKNAWYKASIANLDKADTIEGVTDFILYLKSKNIKVGLGSASKNARTIIQILDIAKHFDVIVDGNDVEKSKPDPEVFEKGAKAMQLEHNDIIVFEDSQKGLEAAKVAGFQLVGIGAAELLPQAKVHLQNFNGLHIETLKTALEEACQ